MVPHKKNTVKKNVDWRMISLTQKNSCQRAVMIKAKVHHKKGHASSSSANQGIESSTTTTYTKLPEGKPKKTETKEKSTMKKSKCQQKVNVVSNIKTM